MKLSEFHLRMEQKWNVSREDKILWEIKYILLARNIRYLSSDDVVN